MTRIGNFRIPLFKGFFVSGRGFDFGGLLGNDQTLTDLESGVFQVIRFLNPGYGNMIFWGDGRKRFPLLGYVDEFPPRYGSEDNREKKTKERKSQKESSG
jgi:hypothetical protein